MRQHNNPTEDNNATLTMELLELPPPTTATTVAVSRAATMVVLREDPTDRNSNHRSSSHRNIHRGLVPWEVHCRPTEVVRIRRRG